MKKLLPYAFALTLLASCTAKQKEDAHLDNTQTQTTNEEQAPAADSIAPDAAADTTAMQSTDTARK